MQWFSAKRLVSMDLKIGVGGFDVSLKSFKL